MDVKAHYKPGFDTSIKMGHLQAFREVRVLGTVESGVYLRGDPRSWCGLVVDAHRSEFAKECSSERDLWWPHCLDTVMLSVKDFESTRIRINDNVTVELGEIDSRRESTRRGVWVLNC